MVIIKATKDYKLIAGLNEELQDLHFRLYPDVFKPYDINAVTTFFEDLLSKQDCMAYVALQESTPVGYIICMARELKENAFQYGGRYLLVDQICVLNKYRRTSTGKLLMQKAEEVAKELSINKMEIEHWNLNQVAAAYFRRQGYVLHRERLYKDI